MTDSGLCILQFISRANINLLHNPQWIIFPIQSYQVWYTFCVFAYYMINCFSSRGARGVMNGGSRGVMNGGARGVMDGGALCVMVIVIGNEHSDTSSNPGRD